MFLKTVQIKNFRGIQDLTVRLDDVCVLIGENNVGKSTVLDALRICLTRSFTRRAAPVFDEYDYYMDTAVLEPTKAKPIEITVTFAERKEEEWSDEISQLLEGAEQVDDHSLRSVTLRITSLYDTVLKEFSNGYDFLDLSGNVLVKAKNPRTFINLQQLVPTFYLASLRDAAQEFRPRSQFWGPFVRSFDLDEESRAEFEAALSELNRKILEKHSSFGTVKDRLKKAADLIPLGTGDPVTIEPLPTKIFDILSRTQISLSSKSGARIPITRHGNGAQSLAVICLFDAFLQSRLESAYGEHAEPLLALEEPEAHLHPSAAKAVGAMLQSLSGQKIITTHSGDLLAGVPLIKIRRLSRRNGEICVHQIGEGVFTKEELDKLDYQVRSSRGSLLFSRCWLLVEGETEGTLLPECARIHGCDLDAEGISCIEFTRVGVEKFIKLADQLGITWFVLADNDPAGLTYENSAKSQLNGRPASDHIRVLDHGDMEVFLCIEGFGSIYESGISSQKKAQVNATKGTPLYWKQVTDAQSKNAKPRNALAVADEIAKKGKAGVPALLSKVIDQAQALARSNG